MGRGTLACWRLRPAIGVDVCWRREVGAGARLFASTVYRGRHTIVCASFCQAFGLSGFSLPLYLLKPLVSECVAVVQPVR